MFVQSLEKAFLLGVPKEYKTRSHHEMKLKGKIDVNAFIKKDIPFQGRISSTNREQIEIQEIIDVLYKTTMIIEKSGFSLKNIAHIKTHLKQHRSKNYISSAVINKALQSKALQNPIFSPYKKVLTYAKYIIQAQSIKQNSDGKNQTYGFLINVAELFEIYVTKLLQKEFSDWDVSSPKITLYQKQFFTRKIIPDIVMIKDKDVMVFDTKYKRMLFREKNQYGSGDVDRNDFFQINTYMSYYQNHASNYRVKVGGLLYPMEGTFEEKKSHSPTWFENANTRFIIDGIELSQLDENSKIADFEEAFINRIKKIT
jgi:5-methylcytosine-specific restriction endonuclease McrBC regulatory subunit McrC